LPSKRTSPSSVVGPEYIEFRAVVERRFSSPGTELFTGKKEAEIVQGSQTLARGVAGWKDPT